MKSFWCHWQFIMIEFFPKFELSLFYPLFGKFSPFFYILTLILFFLYYDPISGMKFSNNQEDEWHFIEACIRVDISPVIIFLKLRFTY